MDERAGERLIQFVDQRPIQNTSALIKESANGSK